MGAFKSLDIMLQELIAQHGRAALLDALATCTCRRCGHTWRPRISGEPKQCPVCKSIRWAAVTVAVTCSDANHQWMNGHSGAIEQITVELQSNGYMVVSDKVYFGADLVAVIK